MAPGIIEIGSVASFDKILSSVPPTKLVVLDFHAVWCGPCHAISPVLSKLAGQYPQVQFLKIDVDQIQELAQRYKITAMPTFKFIKGGKEIAELRGASPPQLSALVKQHSGPVVAASAAPTSAASSSSAPAAPADGSLISEISATGLQCLGESKDHPLSSILGPNAGPKGCSFLESDADPELLISMSFMQAVKIKAISIFGGVSPEQAPKTIRLYVNQNALDFSDAESHEPAQELVLSDSDIRGEKVALKYVRFQNVRTLHILVKDNQAGDETTRIDSLDLFGTVA